jgi:hypothetical protein
MTGMILKKERHSQQRKMHINLYRCEDNTFDIDELELYTKFKIQILRLVGEWGGGGGSDREMANFWQN